LQWISFLATSIYPRYLQFYHPEWFCTDPKAEKSLTDQAHSSLLHNWKIVNDFVDRTGSLGGLSLSLADLYLQMIWSWHPIEGELQQRFPLLNKLVRRATEHESNGIAINAHFS